MVAAGVPRSASSSSAALALPQLLSEAGAWKRARPHREGGDDNPAAAGPQRVPSPTQHIQSDPRKPPRCSFTYLVALRTPESLGGMSSRIFAAWAEVFGAAVAVAPVFDHLVHHAEVIVLKAPKLATRRQTKGGQPLTNPADRAALPAKTGQHSIGLDRAWPPAPD